MKLEDDEISKQMRKDRDLIGWRTCLIFVAVYVGALIMHWLFDFPSSMSGVNGGAAWIGGTIAFAYAGNFVETIILEYRIRLRHIDQKLIAMESRMASINELIEMRLAAIADALKIENIKSAGEQEEAKTSVEPESEEALLGKYRASAERGESWGQHNLGITYLNGTRVPKDNAMAAFWFRKAAEHGDVVAQFYLAELLANGEGLPPDYAEAIRCYRDVAEDGDTYCALAEYELGEMYAKGKGVQKDYKEAARYWQKSAEHGCDLAASKLGRLYERGVEGFPPDFTEAYFWLYVSVESESDKSLNDYRMVERDQIAKRLNPESVLQIQERAQRWLQGERSVATVV